MADFPNLPLWTDAYIGDTQHLTNEEHGVYLRLLICAWRMPTCGLPNDDRRIATMVGVTAGKWAKLKPTIMSFWTLDGDTWKQKRLTKERQRAEKLREQKRSAGKASAEAKSRKTKDSPPTGVITGEPTGDQLPRPRPSSFSSSNEELVKSAVEIWNATAPQCGWSQVQKIGKPRFAAISARLKECGGLDGWRDAVSRASASNFLTGQTERPFFASFDFLTKPANFTKLMEGNYDNKHRPTPPAPNGRGSNPHDSLVAGFAAFANSDAGGSGPDHGSGETSFGASDPSMDFGQGGNPSQPVFRLVGSN